jgi:hypothetical protein
MAKSKQGLHGRVSHVPRRRRKKPANRVERAFDGVKELVSDIANRLFSGSGERKVMKKQVSSKKTGATRKRSAQQRQAAAKKVGATHVRLGRQRQAAAKKAARSRAAKMS